MNSTITLCWLNESSRVVEAKTYPGPSGYFYLGTRSEWFVSVQIHIMLFLANLQQKYFFQFSHTFSIFFASGSIVPSFLQLLPLSSPSPTRAKGQLFVSSLLSQDVCFGRHHIGFYFSCCLLFSYKRCKKVGLAFNIYILLCSFSVVFYNGRRLYC